MATNSAYAHAQTPALVSMRMPSEPSPYALATGAHLLWRLTLQGKLASSSLDSGNPSEEYKSVCEFMRLYATLRFYQLALLLGTSGGIVTALTSNAVHTGFARAELLRTGGLVISLAFLVMEFRASSYWHRLRDRANELAKGLPFPPRRAGTR